MISILDQWKQWWAETEKERPEYDLTNTEHWRVAAARTRSPEDRDWWFTNGYKFFSNWVEWRNTNTNYEIARMPDGTLAVELALEPKVNGVSIKMVIDRVFVDKTTGEYLIVDLKTGKRVPSSHLQLGFYAYGLRQAYGIDATKGYYWMARKGELSQAFDLTDLNDSKIELLVQMFDKARKQSIFVPNFNSCNMCGYAAQCEWYKKGETDDNE
jgi:CRISPR/Cas system-associated exonuclease Cas4 (RecB family)